MKAKISYYITTACEMMWRELKDAPILISCNGKAQKIVYKNNDAFKYVHDHTGQSVPWACVYEGWKVENVQVIHDALAEEWVYDGKRVYHFGAELEFIRDGENPLDNGYGCSSYAEAMQILNEGGYMTYGEED